MNESASQAVDSSPRRWPGPWLWLSVLLGFAYLPMFFGQIIFFRDPAHWNYPARWFVRAALLKGEFPHWNPDQGLGFSVWANPLYGLFYPPNWLYLLVPDALVASMLTWQSFAHLVWGSAGISLLAARLGASRAGACIAGLAWGLGGYTTSAWTAGLLLVASAWIPWCGVGFVALVRALASGDRRRVWRGVAQAAAPAGLSVLMGEVFVALMAIAFGLATAAAVAVAERKRAASPPGRRWIGPVVLALAIAGGAGGITVLPARTIASATDRAAPLARDFAEMCSLHPLRLIEMAVPGAMGNPYEHYPGGRWVGEPRLDGLPLMYSEYVGVGVLAFALMAFGRGRCLAVSLGVLTAIAFLIALGKHTPLHQILRTLVPPLAYMRYPEKYMALFVSWVALLAGLGATRALSSEHATPWRRGLALLGALAGLALAAPALFSSELAAYVRDGSVRACLAGLLVLAALSLARRRPRVATVTAVIGVAADLAAAAWPLQGFGPRRLATEIPPAARVILSEHGQKAAPPRLYRAEKVEPTVARFVPATSNAEGEARSMATLVHNTVTTFGIATLPGYDAAIPTLLSKLWVMGQKTGQSVLRLLGIGYAILPVENPQDPNERRTGIEPMVDPLPGARLYRVPGALPRVYLAGRGEVLSDEAATARIFDDDVVRGGRVLLAPDAGARPVDGAATRAGSCTLETLSPSRVEARCQAERPAVAVFLEQHDVGWSATVDGQPAPLWRGNLLVRAVPIGAGAHTVVLSYTPPSVGWGAVLSLLALLAFVGLLVLGRGRAAG